MNKDFSYFDEETDEEIEFTAPVKKEVCYECSGTGFVLCEGMRGHAYSQEEFDEAFDDDESREQYFKRGGIYDVQCPLCRGKNVIDVVDESKLTPEQKIHFEKYEEYEERKARWDAEDRATMRAENGYRD